MSSNHKEDFYCLNCFNSYTTINKLKERENKCNNRNSCRIEMPIWVEKKLKYNPGEKSLKAPFAIYLDLECLLKKEQSCENNHIQKKKRNMNPLVEQCLQNVHLMKKKIKLITAEEKIV